MQRPSLTASHKNADSLLVSEKQPLWKTRPLLPLPQFLLLSWMLYNMEYCFGQFESAVTAVFPSSCLLPAYWLQDGAGQIREKKSQNISSQNSSFLSTLFSRKSTTQHRGVPMKKATSIPAMPSTIVSTKNLDEIHKV